MLRVVGILVLVAYIGLMYVISGPVMAVAMVCCTVVSVLIMLAVVRYRDGRTGASENIPSPGDLLRAGVTVSRVLTVACSLLIFGAWVFAFATVDRYAYALILPAILTGCQACIATVGAIHPSWFASTLGKFYLVTAVSWTLAIPLSGAAIGGAWLIGLNPLYGVPVIPVLLFSGLLSLRWIETSVTTPAPA